MDEGYTVETHCHTTSSDGRDTPEAVVLEAKRKNIDFLAVTDHNTFRGSILAERAARIHGLEKPVIIHGNEVRTDKGDVVILCSKPLSEVPTGVEELRETANENNCIMIAVHPYSIVEPSVGDLIKGKPSLFDAIEVWNAKNIPLLNIKAWKTAEKLGKPATAGSDAHVKEAIAAAYTIVYAGNPDVEYVLEAIRKGETRPVKGVPGLKALIRQVTWSIIRRL
ncbi:MAG: PHP domain-containing protein [Desulfurococcales archaeon]|nr:PHP domain-containing protein [Desulfurococcales archaeon]